MKSDLVNLFHALADRTRLRLLNLMASGEVCVCYFVELLDEPQPKISRHLAYLRRTGLVAARREGKWMHYRLTKPSDSLQARVLESALAAAADFEELAFDAQDGFLFGIGTHRFVGQPRPLVIGERLFEFIGDGSAANL